MTVWTWSSLARDLQLYLRAPYLLYVATPAFFLLGPALLAYTKRITVGTNPFEQRRFWLHLVPCALFIAAAIPFYRLSAVEKLSIYQGTQTVTWGLGVMLVLMTPHMLIYTLLCLRPIRRYEARAHDNFSDLEFGNLRWLKRLCIGMLILILLDVLLPSLLHVMQWDTGGIDRAALMRMCLLLYTVFLASSALGQPPFMYKAAMPAEEVSVPRTEETDPSPATEDSKPFEKYARSGLRDDSAQYYVEKLHTLMRERQAYLDCGLTLRTLAASLNLRPHHLSQILNEQLGKSFYDYINELRVACAKERLTDKSRAAL
jgi:AraC-like DNA-binding protein